MMGRTLAAVSSITRPISSLAQSSRHRADLIIDLGKPTHWIAIDREQAITLAMGILKKAVDKYVLISVPDDLT